MHLSDVVGHSGLSFYAIVAMLLFMIAFVAVAVWIFRPGRKAELDEMSRMPLEDDARPSPGDDAHSAKIDAHDAPARRRKNG